MADQLKCDLAVLGGGPGGYTAAFRAADLGLSVCLIEQRPQLGGVCLHAGCIPSKTLLHGAELAELARQAAAFGIRFAAPDIDLKILKDKKEGIVKQLAEGLELLCRARKIHRLAGWGVCGEDGTLHVNHEAGELAVACKDLIVATGSHALALPDTPDDPRIWDAATALDMPFVPRRLLIVGGGIIGLEMAQVYGALGTDITIVEKSDRIIPAADRDLVQPLLRAWKDRYRIYTGTGVNRIRTGETGVEVAFGESDLSPQTFDAVLVAIGRRPNTQGFGLENLGLEAEAQRGLIVDARQRTAVAHVYAVGDVTGEPMLAHRAIHQGKVAAEVIAGRPSAFTPMAIPSVAYTSPEIAWVGVTERQAEEEGLAFRKGVFPWRGSGRALCTGAGDGVGKVLFDVATGRLVGAGICGSQAGELINEAVLAMEMGADAEDIGQTVHAHPTLAETFAQAAEIVAGTVTDRLPQKTDE